MSHSQKTASKKLVRFAIVLLAVFVAIRFSSDATSQESETLKELDRPKSISGVQNVTEDGDVKDPPYKPKTKAELKRALTAIQYKVTQSEGTEPAFRNKYWNNKKEGIYRCVVCQQSLFSSDTKYTSGTGWPSFYDPIEKDHVGYRSDFLLLYERTEVHCSRCDAHLGHVFDDGPRNTTGKRYCMNSAAMVFEAKSEKPNGKGAKK